LRILLSVVVAVLPLAGAWWLWRRLGRDRTLSGRATLFVLGAGLAAGAAAAYAERLILRWTELSFDASHGGAASALLAVFLLAAPLEEGLKVLAIWPLYSAHRLTSPRLGLSYAACAACGFAAAESAALVLFEDASALGVARVVVSQPAHVFFAGVWGYALGSGRGFAGGWFTLAWFVAMLLHGLYDHIVFGRGPGLLIVATPLLAFMALGGWLALRDVAPRDRISLPPSMRPLFAALPEPPSLGAMRNLLRRTDRPLMLHWIAIGTLVTMGLMITLIALAVWTGHRMGLDFATADEADVRSSGPLALLGTAVLAAFPIAGFLVARASAAHSVLEPALAAGIAIAVVVALLSVTAPMAVVFALAVAPVAFALACGGAWFGLAR